MEKWNHKEAFNRFSVAISIGTEKDFLSRNYDKYCRYRGCRHCIFAVNSNCVLGGKINQFPEFIGGVKERVEFLSRE